MDAYYTWECIIHGNVWETKGDRKWVKMKACPQISGILWDGTIELSGCVRGKYDPEADSELNRAALPTTGPYFVSSLVSVGQDTAPVHLEGRPTTLLGSKIRASKKFLSSLKTEWNLPCYSLDLLRFQGIRGIFASG